MDRDGVISWRAGCTERRTSGSEGGPGKRTGRKPDTAPRSDPYTYLRCWEGAVFFSFVIDAYSRMTVGWQFAAHMRTGLVLDALRMALHQRAPGADVWLVAHSDAGSQYTSFDYTQLLDDHDVRGSIGTVGDAYDNAAAESFVDSFKTELIADRTWTSCSQLELAVLNHNAQFRTTSPPPSQTKSKTLTSIDDYARIFSVNRSRAA